MDIKKIRNRLMIIENELKKMKPYFYEFKDTKEYWTKYTSLNQEKRELYIKLVKFIGENK